jgi:glucokinase
MGASKRAVAGVDLGGTNITVGVVDPQHRVVERVKTKTPDGGPDAVIAAIVEAVEEVQGNISGKLAGVGVGAPGPVNDGVVKSAPNLEGWTAPVALREALIDELGIPVAVDNDATVGAVGEWVAGAGRGANNLLGVWLGTGVGGGLVLDGRPFSGTFGGAGELGHVVVHRDGALCGCGRRGCLEAYAGRASMERVARVRVAAGATTALTEIMESKNKSRMTSSVWTKAFEQGDEMATELLDSAVVALGVAVGSAINLLDLDTVVIGGGVAERMGHGIVDRIAEAARPVVLVSDVERRFVLARLGDDSGIVGAAWLGAGARSG